MSERDELKTTFTDWFLGFAEALGDRAPTEHEWRIIHDRARFVAEFNWPNAFRHSNPLKPGTPD